MNDLTTIFLAIIAIINGYQLVAQKNARDDNKELRKDFKDLAEKLEHWVVEIVRLKAEHDQRKGGGTPCGD